MRVLIVDDEPLARRRLQRLLEKEKDVESVTSAGNGKEALRIIRKEKPELVFLDIQMPGMNGLELCKSLESSSLHIIFVTAFDEYAVKAFEVHAIDYLLKPFDDERFFKALDHARSKIGSDQTSYKEFIRSFLGSQKSDKILISTPYRSYFLKLSDVLYIQSCGKYVEVVTTKEKHEMKKPLYEVMEKLNSNQFVRIHRSTIINIDHVKELQPWYKGEYIVILNSGEKLQTGRQFRDQLQTILSRY